MSADLWAAFGSPPEPTRAQPSPPQQQGHSSATNDQHKEDGHSDAGSWSAVNEELQNAWLGNQETQQDGPTSRPPEPTTSLSFDSQAPANDDDDFGDFEEPERYASNQGNSLETSGVLVSASEEVDADQDDFGDFEDVEPTKQDNVGATFKSPPRKPRAQMHTDAPSTASRAQNSTFGSLIDFGEPGHGAAPSSRAQSDIRKAPAKEVPVLVAAEDGEDDDAWDDFGGGSINREEVSALQGTASTASAKARQQSAQSQSSKRKGTGLPPPTGPPPSNIPPPSVLLSALVIHLETLPEQIRVSIVETWEDDEADVQKHVDAVVVAARVIAGRKLRWKRDNMLAQSMRIGGAGRPGGMKLAGVDRAESQREDREAAELVRTWRENVGAIRTALAESTSKKPPGLPGVTETIAVRTAKPEDGAVKAAKCCVLCGLRREERAERVDVNVWDQFSEWWTEHWGHTSCREFWEEHEESMQQR